jgi:hypothetical protein
MKKPRSPSPNLTPLSTTPSDETPSDESPTPATSVDLLQLLYDPIPAAPPGPPALPADLLTRPAFGQDQQHRALAPTQEERESESFNWTRNNYHRIVKQIEAIESNQADGIEASLSAQDLRDYVLKQLIGLSGHPDPKVATNALKMLAQSKFVALFDEARKKPPGEMNADDLDAEIRKLMSSYTANAAAAGPDKND